MQTQSCIIVQYTNLSCVFQAAVQSDEEVVFGARSSRVIQLERDSAFFERVFVCFPQTTQLLQSLRHALHEETPAGSIRHDAIQKTMKTKGEGTCL